MAKFRRRSERWHQAVAFVLTLGEAVLTLLGVRALWRLAKRGGAKVLQIVHGRRTQVAT